MPFFNLPATGGGDALPVLTGDGAPDNSAGADGQLYIDTLNRALYVKEAGAWGAGVFLGALEWADITNKPAEFPPAAHGHVIADIDGLTTALAGKADATHSHEIADVNGLGTALDGKQAAGSYANEIHSHLAADITDRDTALVTSVNGQVGAVTVTAGGALSDALPLALGTASAGTAVEAARADHVHPSASVPIDGGPFEGEPLITFTTQPTNQTAVDGIATFTALATATIGSVIYQWQTSLDGIVWENISGQQTTTLVASGLTLGDNGRRYRVAVTAVEVPTIYSDSATVTVPPPPQGWTQIGAPLTGSQNNDAFGADLSMSADGSVFAIASGAQNEYVRFFVNNSGLIQQRGLDITTFSQDADDDLGFAVRLNATGQTAIIGQSGIRNAQNQLIGMARVYDWDGAAWVQRGADLVGGASFGAAVAISDDGNTVAVGEYQFGTTPLPDTGRIAVWQWSGAEWSRLGGDIVGSADDRIGFSLAMDAAGAAIVAGNLSLTDTTGVARVYRYDGSAWADSGAVFGQATGDRFGHRVALSNDGLTIAVSSERGSVAGTINYRGYTKTFSDNGAQWVQLGQTIEGDNVNDFSGSGMALSGDGQTLAIGSIGAEPNVDSFFTGQVRVFRLVNGQWADYGNDIFGTTNNEAIGASVALSDDGETLIAGGSNYSSQRGIARILTYV